MNRRNVTLLVTLAALAGMVGLVAESVPLYRLFCQVTGISGQPTIAARGPEGAASETITVRFDTNVNADMPWTFRPEASYVRVHPGEKTVALFRAMNESRESIVGTAVFNVTPPAAAQYVDKIQCFCFARQRLAAGESAEMPVLFYIDPAFVKDKELAGIRTVTLSYTFYKSRDQSGGETAANPQPPAAANIKEGKS